MNGVPRIPSPHEWVKTRLCTACGKSKPWAQFSPKTYWPDGAVRTVASWCHDCENESQRSRARASQSFRNDYKRRWDMQNRRRDGGRQRLPVLPLREFILQQIREGTTQKDVADQAGVSERAIYRFLSGEHQHASLGMADQIITRLGFHLYDVYPELLDEEMAA